MICPSCSSENSTGAKFCNECGTALASGCPNCGATNRPEARFCNECGAALGARGDVSAPAPAAVAAQAERRLVTVLFADLVGFTPFAEERDAEEVRDTLSRYFDTCSEIIGRYGGTVEKFIGDAVMAVWGAPVAHEDDAERAVRAALDLVDSVRNLAPNAQARAGVLTGEAAVTIGATNQGMVAGDLVNTASRLQAVAPPGTVLVGESTHRAAGAAIHFEPAGDQLLKGKQAPVPAWRATRVIAELGGRNRSESLEAPFVGRADELRLLKDLFHATAREKRIRLVSIMGPAGIGKSRLAWEFSKYTDGLVEDTYWHIGRSPAYGDSVTFWALGEMIRRRCGLAEDDDEQTTRRKVSETVERWIDDASDRQWVERALLTLLSFESGMAPEQLFGAWRTLFERIAGFGTVALIFEDMHNADSGLLDFVDHLLEWSRGLPIFVVTLARPELLDRRPDWGAGKRSFTSIHLEPLAEAEMRELLSGLVPGLPERATAAIVARADGIPLYAVETVRMLIGDGRLREEGGVYVPAGELELLAVPETLTALIASRLDALEVADRSLIHDAAVLGQSFTTAALAALSGVDVDTLEERLRGLARRELVERDVDPRSPERGQYAFVQALIREVAYNTLSRRDRKALHLAAARYFESLGSEELAGALASHYLSAHENASPGPEADTLAAQARIALRAAAERAAALGAHDQAVTFLEQALAVTVEPAERAALLERTATSANIATRYEMAVDMLHQALRIYADLGDRVARARASSLVGWALLNARRDRDAIEVLEGALEEFGDLWPDPTIVELKVHAARAYLQLEKQETALRLADEALEVAEHANFPPIIARALIAKGGALATMGRLREGVALARAGEEIARELDQNETVLTALTVRAFHLGEVDNRAAGEVYRQGLELARRIGHRRMALQFANNVGYTGFVIGEWDAALRELDAALAEDVPLSDQIWLMSNAQIIRASRGEPVEEAMAEMDRLVVEHGDENLQLPALDTKANAALASGRLQEARDHARRLAERWAGQAPSSYYQAARPALWAGNVEGARADLAALDATGYHGPVVEARRTTVRAGIAALEGRTREALALYGEALGAWRALSVTWEEALAGIDMVTLLDPAQAEVRAVASSTRAILERLGARPYLERLELALAGPASQAGRTEHVAVAESA